MQHKYLTFLTISVLSIVVFIFFWLAVQPLDLSVYTQEAQSELEITEPSITFVNPSRGAEEPLLTIIEFSDFECGACKTLATPLEIALATYKGQVRHVWKNLPNESLHQFATPAAIAAHCADRQGLFWEYHDEVFNRQSYLSEEQFTQIAIDLGLDISNFQACYEQRETLAIVKRDFDEGIALGLTSTPTLFVGDEIFVGAITSDRLLESIERQLLELTLEQ